MALLTGVDAAWDGEKELTLSAVPTAPETLIDLVAGADYSVTNVDTTATARYRNQAAQPAANARSLRLAPGASMTWRAPPDDDTATVRTWFWSHDVDGCSLLVS